MATLMCAVFEDTRSAEQALRALEAGGFPRRQMGVRSGDQLSSSKEQQRGDRGDGGGVLDRLRALLGKRESSAQKSSEQSSQAASGGDREAGAGDEEAIVILNVSDDRVGRAAQILGETGALDLDARLGRPERGEASEQPIYAVVIEEEVAIEDVITPAEADEGSRARPPSGD